MQLTSISISNHTWPICKYSKLDTFRNNRAAWQRSCLQATRTSNRAILVTSYRPGNYQCLFTNWNGKLTNGPQLHRKQYCFTVSICHLVKVYLKTLESNCNWKIYLADSRFVPPIDLLTFPPIGGTFLRIQDGNKPMSLEILFYLVSRSRKKASLGTRMTWHLT
jgi:hypothetical protein